MRNAVVFIGMALVTGIVAAVGCGNGGTSGPTGSGGSTSTATSTHSSTTTTTTTTSTHSSTSTTSTTTSTTGVGGAGGAGVGGGFGGGVGGSLPDPYECTVPSPSPSAGSCATVVAENDAGTGIECNPVTNAPCMATEQCDTNFDNSGNFVGFICWPSDNVAVCKTCDPNNGMACGPGLTCFTYDNAGDSACTKYCCTDADCGAGKCTTMDANGPFFAPVSTTLGVCTLM